jgi:RecB family exonuclease
LFLSGVAAAQAVLRATGASFRIGEEELRSVRLARLFERDDLGLKHFPIDLLREAQGWDDAFARTIGELERAGLDAAELEGDGHAALRDIGHVWRLLNEQAGESWTAAHALREAAATISAKPETWPFPGVTLAAITGHESAVHARFVGVIPGIMLAVREARPYRAEHLSRLRDLFGAGIGAPTPSPGPTGNLERELLAAYLFEPPESLTAPDREASTGPDSPATVVLEEHAGLESELEAAADWVAERVLVGTPLEDIAILTPGNRELSERVAERLQRLPWENGALPVYLAEGQPAACSAAGARMMAVVRALRAWLSAEALASILPSLKAPSEDSAHLSREEAIEVVYSLGTLGGSPAYPSGALVWKGRLADAERRLAAQGAKASAIVDAEALAGAARDHGRNQGTLARIRAARTAIDALCDLARLVVEERPLAELWQALRAFLEAHVLLPSFGPPLPAVVESALEPLLDDRMSVVLAGDDAMHAIEEALDSATFSGGRFGEPAVYVGSLSGAAGIPFRAARVIGMCEGALPSVPREDPVLPRELLTVLTARVQAARMVRMASERALAQLHDFDRLVRDTSDAIALSAPALDAERTQREPSAVFIEVAAAVGRPDRLTGKTRSGYPSLGELRRNWFEPARQASVALRTEAPLTPAAWQDRVAAAAPNNRSIAVPVSWSGRIETDLARIRALAAVDAPFGAQDGLIGDRALMPRLPGLDPEWAISASSLSTLLSCPQKFLYENVMRWRAPAGAPSPAAIDSLQYGSLFHEVAESFFREHGEGFLASGSKLSKWLEGADAIADRAFDELAAHYAFASDSVRDSQRDHLRREFREFLLQEIDGAGKTQFAAVERSFGYPTPVRIPAGRHALHVHGFIDRIDRRAGTTVVRDLKTGKSKPRQGDEKDPTHTIDVQLGLYGIVTKRLASEWGLPDRIEAAYHYVSGRGEPERAFREDYETLEEAANGWLRLAARLLAEALFPRTPIADDCSFCSFQAVCGSNAPVRAAAALDGAKGALGTFRDMKMGGDGE